MLSLLFFAYDLRHYRDTLRGFYFDLEARAPGPVLATSADVVDALADMPAMTMAYADAYARFRDTHCHLDAGHAARRVADRFVRSTGRVEAATPA